MDLEEFISIVGKVFVKDFVDKGIKGYENCIGRRDIWDNLENIETNQVNEIVVPFLNKWKCRLPYTFVPQLTRALQEVEQWLRPLRKLYIENIDFFQSINWKEEEFILLYWIEKLFNIISKVKVSGRTVGFTATSKILHMAIPELFVMSDRKIREFYGCAGNGAGYANFMMRMSHIAQDLILQAGGEKQMLIDLIGREDRTLARLLDNYNMVKVREG